MGPLFIGNQKPQGPRWSFPDDTNSLANISRDEPQGTINGNRADLGVGDGEGVDGRNRGPNVSPQCVTPCLKYPLAEP
jgi:hypothetical protein